MTNHNSTLVISLILSILFLLNIIHATKTTTKTTTTLYGINELNTVGLELITLDPLQGNILQASNPIENLYPLSILTLDSNNGIIYNIAFNMKTNLNYLIRYNLDLTINAAPIHIDLNQIYNLFINQTDNNQLILIGKQFKEDLNISLFNFNIKNGQLKFIVSLGQVINSNKQEELASGINYRNNQIFLRSTTNSFVIDLKTNNVTMKPVIKDKNYIPLQGNFIYEPKLNSFLGICIKGNVIIYDPINNVAKLFIYFGVDVYFQAGSTIDLNSNLIYFAVQKGFGVHLRVVDYVTRKMVSESQMVAKPTGLVVV
ncbi:hypothetical protein ABK040_001395 [Willaertia magna]